MKTFLLVILFAIAGLKTQAADQVIRSLGEYPSRLHTTNLSITSDSQNVKFRFSFKGKDGRITSVENQCGISSTWACFIEDEMTVWFYKGGDTVTASTIIEKEGTSLEFSSSSGVFDIMKERDLIPKPLLEFIEKAPNKALQTTTTAVTDRAVARSAPAAVVSDL